MKLDYDLSKLTIEAERDHPNAFRAEVYISDGFYPHFHRNPEIYLVYDGTVGNGYDKQCGIRTARRTGNVHQQLRHPLLQDRRTGSSGFCQHRIKLHKQLQQPIPETFIADRDA